MTKTKRLKMSLVSLMTVICLLVGLGVYGAVQNKKSTGGGYQANNNVQSTATADDSMLIDGAVIGGSEAYKKGKLNDGSFNGWTPISNQAELKAWLNNADAGNAYLTNDITDFSWGREVADNGSRVRSTLDGCGYSISNIYETASSADPDIKEHMGWTSDTNRAGSFVQKVENTGRIINLNYVQEKYTFFASSNNGVHRLSPLSGENAGAIENVKVILKNTWAGGPWSKQNENVAQESTVGGITGLNMAGGSIKYATVEINSGAALQARAYSTKWYSFPSNRKSTANSFVGSIAGDNQGNITNVSLKADTGARITAITGGEGNNNNRSALLLGLTKDNGILNGAIIDIKESAETVLNASNGSKGYITAAKSGNASYENIYSNTQLTGLWVNGATENGGTVNHISDNATFNMMFDKTNTENVIFTSNDPSEIFWSINRDGNAIEGYEYLYRSLTDSVISIPKFSSNFTNNNSSVAFEVAMGRLLTDKFTVGYASGDKVFDGNAIEINNIHGLNLTNSVNPRNAGTYNFEIIPDEAEFAQVDNANRFIIPMSSVELGITELTISPKDININLSAMSGLIYNGELQSGVSMNITDTDGNSIQDILDKEALNMNWNNTDKATDAGMHEAFLSDYNRNYNIVDNAYIQFNIGQKTVKPVWSDVLNFKANGKLQLPNVTWEGAVEKDIATAFNVTSNGGINASNDAYTATASVNSNNYIMVGDAQITVEYYINFLTVTAVSLNQFGTVTVDKSEVDYNETVKLSTATKFGYAVTSIMLNGIETGAGTRQFNITEDTVFELTFGARDVNVTISAENGTVTNDKEFKYNNEITLTAVPNTGYEFLNWTTSTGVILSNESTYTFIAIDNFEITANFVTASENGVIYTFLSANGQLMKTIYAEEGSINLDEIQGTFLPGYTFTEWRAVSGKLNTYIARYDIDATAEKMLVTVNGGTLMLSDVTEYTYNSVVTVIANEGAFKYWQDANGQILSYEREYKFAILENTEVTAVFEESAETKNSVAINSIKDNGESWAFSASFASIEGYSVIEAGIMITSDANIATSENFVMGSKVMYAKSNKISKYNQYMITANKSVMNAGYARAYMIVNNGTENVIVYSDVIVSTASAN